jgi:acetyl esterase/lipase
MANQSDSALWDSVPWQEWLDPSSTQKKLVGWHKPSVPYINGGNGLQNLDVWIPSTTENPSPPKSEVFSPNSTHNNKGVWVVYIHGGAWCDPQIKADSFGATLDHVVKSHASSLSKIAGFASLNYTLSPKDRNPTHPADPSREGKHPDHILDVLRGLAFLQTQAGFWENYVLLGHSCGATLAFQVLMDVARWSSSPPASSLVSEETTTTTTSSSTGGAALSRKVSKPVVVIGLDGLYDLPGLIKDPGEKHARWIPEYEAFTRFAFGDDERTWYDVSPISVKDWVAEWGRNDGKVVLVQSKDDTLVPYRQLEGMYQALKPSIAAGLDVFELPASGDHDELWQTGDQIAGIIVQVLDRLS